MTNRGTAAGTNWKETDMSDAPKSIDQVVITEDDSKALFDDDAAVKTAAKPKGDPDPEPDPIPNPDDIQDNGKGKEGDPEPVIIKIDEKEYTQDEIRKAIQGHLRQDDYTKKMKDLSENRKSIDRIANVFKTITKDDGALKRVRETIEDEYGEDVAKIFDDAIKTDPGESPYKSEVETANNEKNVAVAELELYKESISLQRKYHLKDTDIQAVIDYATKEFEESNQTKVLSLEDAYRLMNFDTIKKTADVKTSPKPKVPDLATKNKGVRDFEKATPKSFNDISVKDLEDANLFDT